MTIPPAQQTQTDLLELNQLTTHATKNLPELLRRARIPTGPDGYPTNTLNDQPPGTRLDDQGHPIPPLTDPTGELATQRDHTAQHDMVTLWGTQAATELHEALSHLRHLTRLIALANRVEEESRGRENTSRSCAGCARVVAQSANDRLRSGLCDACRKWKRRRETETGQLLSTHDVARARMPGPDEHRGEP